MVKTSLSVGGSGQVKCLKSLGLFNSKDKAVNEVEEIYLNPESLVNLIEAVYDVTPEELEKIRSDIDNVSIEDVLIGYWDFFDKLNPPVEKWIQLLKNSTNLTQTTKS